MDIREMTPYSVIPETINFMGMQGMTVCKVVTEMTNFSVILVMIFYSGIKAMTFSMVKTETTPYPVTMGTINCMEGRVQISSTVEMGKIPSMDTLMMTP